jgi:hypothetical protein
MTDMACAQVSKDANLPLLLLVVPTLPEGVEAGNFIFIFSRVGATDTGGVGANDSGSCIRTVETYHEIRRQRKPDALLEGQSLVLPLPPLPPPLHLVLPLPLRCPSRPLLRQLRPQRAQGLRRWHSSACLPKLAKTNIGLLCDE